MGPHLSPGCAIQRERKRHFIRFDVSRSSRRVSDEYRSRSFTSLLSCVLFCFLPPSSLIPWVSFPKQRSVLASLSSCCSVPSNSKWRRDPSTPSPERRGYSLSEDKLILTADRYKTLVSREGFNENKSSSFLCVHFYSSLGKEAQQIHGKVACVVCRFTKSFEKFEDCDNSEENSLSYLDIYFKTLGKILESLWGNKTLECDSCLYNVSSTSFKRTS